MDLVGTLQAVLVEKESKCLVITGQEEQIQTNGLFLKGEHT